MPASTPSEVEYVNAHGTSTPLGDLAETLAIKRAFGDHAYKTDGQLDQVDDRPSARRRRRRRGDLHACWRCTTSVMPPTINLDNPGEGCDLDYVPNVARQTKIDVAMSNGFGFGGTNGTLVFRRI